VFRTSFEEINAQLAGVRASFAEKRVQKYSDALLLLQRLRFCRSRLCDAVDDLNELFGICVLLALLSYNIYVHLVVYLVLTEVIDFIYDVTNQMNFGTVLVWLAIDIFFISTYFQGCVRTSLEVRVHLEKLARFAVEIEPLVFKRD
jgi:7tm Chemosensory receptor